MNLLEFLWDLFRAPKRTEFTNIEKITNDEIRNLLLPYTNNLWLSDGEATLINDSDIDYFLIKNPVNMRKYITESHDCDDFSFELMGDVSDIFPQGAFGMVWGNRIDGVPHAWNFYINHDKQIKYIEPQTDEIFVPSTEKVWIMII